MHKNKTGMGTEAFKLLSFALLTIYFVGIAIYDGPVRCVDTDSYIDMVFSREPAYPLFLLALRRLFEARSVTAIPYGLPSYLTAAVILQSLLWVCATFHLGTFILDVTTALGEKKSRILSAIAMLSQAGVAALNRFIANRGSMYSESILTESLAMPLYVIFTVELVKSFDCYDGRSILKLFFLSVIMASIRKQMLLVLIMWGFASFIIHLFVKRHRSLKNFSLTVIAVVIAIVSITLIDCSYNLAVRGVFTQATGGYRRGLNTLLYSATMDDAKHFADADPEKYPDAQALFTKLYEQCAERQLTIDNAPGYEGEVRPNIFDSDWVSMTAHYADAFDIIGFDVVLPTEEEYVAEHFPELDEVHARMKQDEVEKFLFRTLLKNAFSRIIKGEDKAVLYVLTGNILKAFVISNTNIIPRFLIMGSAFIYAFYFAVFIGLFLKKKTSQRAVVMRLMFIVMAGIAINCVVTGSMIFPQPRYMCYGMGLFYLSLLCGILI